MTEIKVQTIEKNFDTILELVGQQSFVNWDKFSGSSSGVINAIDELNKKMVRFREFQHKSFIQTMKKLKSLDLPDLIAAVKAKKLPKEALRAVLPRFKLGENEKIELVDTIQSLKQNANKDFEEYLNRNSSFLEELKKYQAFIEQRITEFGFAPEQPVEPLIRATIKFNLSEELAAKISNDIKIEYVPGTSYLTFKSYNQIVEKSFGLIKEENTRITKQARVLQRENIKDDSKYLTIMNEYLLNGEALIIDGQRLLAKKLGLSDNKLEESEIFLMERGLSQHMLMVQSQLRSKVKQSLPPQKDVPFETAKEVIVFQTKMIKDKQDIIKKILSGVPKTQDSVQTIPMLLALILNDMVFTKYGFEEEDFMKNVSEEIISTNEQLAKIFKDMELSIIKLMQFIGIIPEEVGKVMEQNALNPQVPQGVNPGIMAGSNPMQMLQMQQMQQMQQMMGRNQTL